MNSPEEKPVPVPDDAGIGPAEAARRALEGHWWQAAFVSVTLMAAMTLISGVQALFTANGSSSSNIMSFFVGIVCLLLWSLLADGGILICAGFIRKEPFDYRKLIAPFRNKPDRFLIDSLVKTAAASIFFAPVILWSLVPSFPSLSLPALIGFYVLGTVLTVAFHIIYMPSVFLLLENDEEEAIPALRKAREIMRGNRRRLLFVLLPFIGYLALTVITAGVASIWVIPYLMTTIAAFRETL